MRVLFDQGTLVPMGRFLNSPTAATVYEKGWHRSRIADLLRLAEQQMLEVFLATGQNLQYQQKLTDRQIADQEWVFNGYFEGRESFF